MIVPTIKSEIPIRTYWELSKITDKMKSKESITIDGGKEIVTVPAPFVAIVQKGIAKEPRIAAMRGIMMARTKVIKLYEPVAIDALTETAKFEMPAPRAACKFVDAEYESDGFVDSPNLKPLALIFSELKIESCGNNNKS